ncbi:MAG: TlpA family protein disulfide reductase, partial [Bacteroidota bacterium]|nr:TlpA family protein disulfide reductase [Bacteroidota bacterium]
APAGNLANTTAKLEGVVYRLGDKGQMTDELDLKKAGDKYIAVVKTDTTDNFIFFSFSADKKFDNNFNSGYWIPLYDGDKIKKRANANTAAFYQFYGRDAGVEPNNDKALQYMDEEFKLYPEFKKNDLVQYVRLYSRVKKEEAPAFIQKEIEEEIKSGLKEEEEYSTLESLYTLANLPEQSKMIKDIKKEKFPKGIWVREEFIQKYFSEKELPKKEQMLDEIIKNINTDSAWKYLEPSLSYFKNNVPNAYLAKGDWDGVKKAIAKYDIKGANLASIYNNTAWEMQKTDKNLKEAEEMSKIATDWAKAELKTPSEKKPEYLTNRQWQGSRENTYAMDADTYAMIMYKEGNYKKGFPYTKDAAIVISKAQDPNFNNTYALLAEKALPPKEYVRQLEQFVKDGKSTPDIKDILKQAYIKKHHSENGYDDYVAALEKASYLKLLEDLRKGMLNDKAPSFTLVDLKGEKIDLEDLKNKTVIVDFWATWCGPCKASFPAMQKMVAKYKNDKDVKFVFVDTWEREDNKEKNAADFISNNKYDFHVLMDNDSKVVEQFKVSGIPTKFVIDKNGMIRFKAIGFDGSDDKLVSELTAMIDMAKSM